MAGHSLTYENVAINDQIQHETIDEAATPSSGYPVTSSKWGIGWQTPALMIAFYLLSFVLAVTHLAMFLYLDRKPADGPDRVAPQSYISTASVILSNSFGLSLNASLAVVFTQYLWYLFRRSTMEISTIEALYTIRSSPLMLFKRTVFQSSPILSLIALMAWIIQIAVNFPPGAITIVMSYQNSTRLKTVPAFDPTYVGNGSGIDASRYFFDGFWPAGDSVTDRLASNSQRDIFSTSLQRVAAQTLINGGPIAMPSPCGPNCSYSLEFDAPYFKCDLSSSPGSIDTSFAPTKVGGSATNGIPIYIGSWTRDPPANYSTDWFFNITSSSLIGFARTAATTWTTFMTNNNLACQPFRRTYTLFNTYVNNIQTISVTTNSTDSELFPLVVSTNPAEDVDESDGETNQDLYLSVPGFFSGQAPGWEDEVYSIGILGTAHANWSNFTLSAFRDFQIMALVYALAIPLSGSFSAAVDIYSNQTGISELNGTVTHDVFTGVKWSDDLLDDTAANENGTIIVNTRFSSTFGKFRPTTFGTYNNDTSSDNSDDLFFEISEEGLNQALVNITLSAMTAFGLWNATTHATIFQPINIYKFSKPQNFLVPYFLCLAMALPSLVLGIIVLKQNGVAASDNSFIQLITTTTGSKALEKVAAGTCLGGAENASTELKELKIRFGELVDRERKYGVRRAGFGTEEETLALTSRALYGATD